MKKKIEYTNEPKEAGWEMDASRRLTRGEIAALGIPAAGELVEWERAEAAGVVTLRPGRGGARRGAGRKPSGHVRMQLLVSPETRRKIESLARRRKVTLSEAVEHMAALALEQA